jgi:hypothetical protein
MNNNNNNGPAKVRQENIGKKREIESLSFDWWNLEGDDTADSVQAVVNNIVESQTYQRTLNFKFARLYGNLEMFGLGYGTYTGKAPQVISSNSVTYNVVKSVIDTAAAKISKNRPRPMFLTSGGDYSQQQKAKKLTKYIDGVFYDTKAYVKVQQSFIDACVFGTGVIKIWIEDNRIQLERVSPTEIVVDDADGRYSKPKQMHQVRLVARQALLESYPEKTDQIKSAHSALAQSGLASDVSDMIQVTESWYLGKKHAITISNCTLFEEDYDKDYFPFVFYKWNERLAGFFGQGMTENLVGIQIEINKILRNIQKAQSLASVPRVFIENGSKVSPAQFTNQIGSVIKYTGQRPVVDTASAMNAEIYNHLKWLISSAYEVEGVSQLSATSAKPAGLDSGVALREYNDIETERFILNGQRYESMFLEMATVMIDMSRDIYAADKGLTVNVPGGDFIETIKWKDVDLRDEEFIMKVYPASLLPTTPAGRLQKIQELIQSGMISPEEGRELLDFPDFEAYATLESADKDLTKKVVGQIVEGGEYNPPEPEQQLDYCAKYAQQQYLEGLISKLPEKRLELLLRYIDDANRLAGLMAAPVAPVQPGPSAPPADPLTAVPEALPMNDLIPQV